MTKMYSTHQCAISVNLYSSPSPTHHCTLRDSLHFHESQDYNTSFTAFCLLAIHRATRHCFTTIHLPTTRILFYALLNCSFRKNAPKPIGTASWSNNATQNHAEANPSRGLMQRFGNTLPGPSLSGAVARATIVVKEPRICAAISVKRTWMRVRVWRSIIPKPEGRGRRC